MKKIASVLIAMITLAVFVIMPLNDSGTWEINIEAHAKDITVFSQTDSRWKNHPYGYSNTAGTTPAYLGVGASGNVGSGCGILAYVNAVYYLNGNFIEPTFLADWSVNNGHRVNGVGTAFSLYSSFANAYGEQYGFYYNGSSNYYADMIEHLRDGEVAIASAAGHIMAIVDYDSSSGKFLILDSCKSTNRHTYSTGYTWETKESCQATTKLNFESAFYFLKSNGVIPSCNCSESYAGYYQVTTSQYPLTIRSGHGTGYSAIGEIPKGETVYVEKGDGSWAHVTYGGVSGYCSMEYLSTVNDSMVTPTISIGSTSYRVGDTVSFSWAASPESSNLSHYWLLIDAPDGNRIVNETMNRNTSYSFTVTQEGTYGITALATPKGSLAGEDSLTDYITINVSSREWYEEMSPLNLGDDFKALILNTAHWKPIGQDDNGNVCLFTELYSNHNRNLWHFIRQSDGSYVIWSYLNGQPLSLQECTDANGINIVCGEPADASARNWFIYQNGDGFWLKPACASRVIDLDDNSSDDYTNIQLWEKHDGEAQRFSIYQLNADRDTVDYTIDADQTSVQQDSTVKVTISGTLPYVYNYKFHIIAPDGNETVTDNQCDPTYNFSGSDVGQYTIYAEVKNPLYTETGSLTNKAVTIIVTPRIIKGDCNQDGKIGVLDVVMLQKWLINDGTKLTNWKAADLYENGVIDVFDLCMMKRMLLQGDTTRYQVIDKQMTWTEAKAYCESIGGHLAVITSAEEQEKIEQLLTETDSFNAYWIGGYVESNVWKWVTGEKFAYTNWAEDQPDGESDEMYTQMFRQGNSHGLWDDTWNDGDHGGGIKSQGCICQWD